MEKVTINRSTEIKEIKSNTEVKKQYIKENIS